MGRKRLGVIVVDEKDLVQTLWPAIKVLFLVRIVRTLQCMTGLLLAFYDRREHHMRVIDMPIEELSHGAPLRKYTHTGF